MRGSVRIAFIVALIWCVSSHAAETATLAGRIVRPGGTLEIQFPIDKAFQDVDLPLRTISTTIARAESLRIFPPLVRANIFSRHRSTDIVVVKNALETVM